MVCAKLCAEVWGERLRSIKDETVCSLATEVDKYSLISGIKQTGQSGRLSEMIKGDILSIVLFSWVLNNNNDNNNQHFSVIQFLNWGLNMLPQSSSFNIIFISSTLETRRWGYRKGKWAMEGDGVSEYQRFVGVSKIMLLY